MTILQWDGWNSRSESMLFRPENTMRSYSATACAAAFLQDFIVTTRSWLSTERMIVLLFSCARGNGIRSVFQLVQRRTISRRVGSNAACGEETVRVPGIWQLLPQTPVVRWRQLTNNGWRSTVTTKRSICWRKQRVGRTFIRTGASLTLSS